MGDFLQAGPVTTIHRLGELRIDDLASRLERFSRDRSLALLIPALASEMDTPALGAIFERLASAAYLEEIVLVLGRADRDDYRRLEKLVDPLPMRTTVVWPEGPKLSRVLASLRPGLDVGPPGKGRDVWIALGYILYNAGAHAIALHDADIVGYTGEIPMRLLLPVADPILNFAFCKGYYTRIADNTLQGRVTRLLVAPLVAVLREENPTDVLMLIGAMRYPLAGECAFTLDLAGRISIPRDWGMEAGILAAIAGEVEPSGICQAGICENYDHKHQALSAGDERGGLNRMAVEVAETLLRGSAPAGGWKRDLVDRYRRKTDIFIAMYRADALANGLNYDDEAEKMAVETFAGAVSSGLQRSEGRQDLPPLPAWRKLERSNPGIMAAIAEAVRNEGEEV
ncbi:glucosyl-3-phosphoglycerate synthase [bacterium BMS3Abin14]|nr:glucosyl-3-phosphoglycerate synthase [bacterium BMS3Abin14]